MQKDITIITVDGSGIISIENQSKDFYEKLYNVKKDKVSEIIAFLMVYYGISLLGYSEKEIIAEQLKIMQVQNEVDNE